MKLDWLRLQGGLEGWSRSYRSSQDEGWTRKQRSWRGTRWWRWWWKSSPSIPGSENQTNVLNAPGLLSTHNVDVRLAPEGIFTSKECGGDEDADQDEVRHDRVALQPVTEDPGQNDFGDTDVWWRCEEISTSDCCLGRIWRRKHRLGSAQPGGSLKDKKTI